MWKNGKFKFKFFHFHFFFSAKLWKFFLWKNFLSFLCEIWYIMCTVYKLILLLIKYYLFAYNYWESNYQSGADWPSGVLLKDFFSKKSWFCVFNMCEQDIESPARQFSRFCECWPNLFISLGDSKTTYFESPNNDSISLWRNPRLSFF